MRAGTVPQQRDVAERRQAIGLLAFRQVGHGCDNVTVQVLGRHEDMTVMSAGYALGRVKLQQFASRDPIQYAPKLAVRIYTNVGRSRFALWPAVEVEA